MREGRHDFMARVGDEIVVVKDVPALICDTCGEVEYTLETSREIDAIIKDFFRGTAAGQAPGGGGDRIQAPAGRFYRIRGLSGKYARKRAKAAHFLSAGCAGGDLLGGRGGEDPKGKSKQAEPGRPAIYIE